MPGRGGVTEESGGETATNGGVTNACGAGTAGAGAATAGGGATLPSGCATRLADAPAPSIFGSFTSVIASPSPSLCCFSAMW